MDERPRELPPALRRALASYRRRLEERFAPRLRRLVLFGCWARGEATERSDVDVLVVVAGMSFEEEREAARMGADVCEETDVWLSPAIYSEERFEYLRSIESPFASAVARERLPACPGTTSKRTSRWSASAAPKLWRRRRSWPP